MCVCMCECMCVCIYVCVCVSTCVCVCYVCMCTCLCVPRRNATDEQRRESVMQIIQQARQQGRQALTEGEAKAILELYGVPVPQRRMAQNQAAASQAAQEMGFPVVMKIASADITHKTEAGGVRLGIQDAQQAAQAYEEIIAKAKAYNPQAMLDGVLVEQTVSDGLQVIVGFKQDPRFGPVVTFGLGGIFVELIRDITLRVVPLDEQQALDMIRETKAYPLLAGYRGEQPRDINALSQVILYRFHKWCRLARSKNPSRDCKGATTTL